MEEHPSDTDGSGASEEQFQRLFRKHSAIMLLIDPATGEIVDANRAAATFYGYAEDVLRTMRITQINTLPPEEIRAEMQRAMQEKRNYFVFRHRRADGEIRIVEIHSSAIDVQERTLLFSIVFDITERRQAEESLRLASLVYESSSEAMTIVDANRNVVTVNPAFTEITGYTAEEVIGRSIDLLGSEEEDPDRIRAMREELDATGRWIGEVWARRKNGERFLRWLSISTIYNEDGTAKLQLGLFSDITKKKAADELIWRQAHFDALTGLPNRTMFHDRLVQAIKKASRNGTHVGLLFLDLDFFKEVNDTLGHGMGDKLLLLAARRLQQCVRGADTVVRLGGDEFIVIVDELSVPTDIERVVQSILHELAEPFELGGEQVFISASAGVTFYPEDGTEPDVLLKNADQAMYAAKSQGRNRYSYFTQSMQEAAQARKRLVSDLRTALAERQFCLHYQPVVDLATGAIRKVEALVRWRHPVRGLIGPMEFIPVAEQTGLIVDIGDWVFRSAARQLAAWRNAFGIDLQISVNVSPVQFQSEGIRHAEWLQLLQELGLRGQSIVVEITEGLLMDARPEITGQLLTFRDNGMQVSIDDFGTGYSSLSYLRKFDIDVLKIDRSFVSNLARGSDDMALCEAIIVMAHKLGIKVVAEGVETEEQRCLLADSGCDYGQGYLFSRPIDAEDVEGLLRRS
jgi:diguanylate cyclase (GGDEF)-like protein/PAS domain S-box-containing protein